MLTDFGIETLDGVRPIMGEQALRHLREGPWRARRPLLIKNPDQIESMLGPFGTIQVCAHNELGELVDMAVMP